MKRGEQHIQLENHVQLGKADLNVSECILFPNTKVEQKSNIR